MVDDEETVRRALERFLRGSGYSVRCFASGAAFLESLGTQRPDCLVLDIHMPQLDGFEVCSRLVAMSPSIPVVFITGYDTPETRERAERAGASAYLRKPVDGAVLLDAIRLAMRS